MSEDKTITMEIISFVKYKDECNEVGEVIKHLLNKLDEKNDKIEKLQSIMNNLEEWLNDYLEHYKDAYYINDVLDKLQELKGSSNNG